MKCLKQPRFLDNKPIQINDLWEVRLPLLVWRQIKRLAVEHKLTNTTITRFCAFRLASLESLHWSDHLKLKFHSVKSQSKSASNQHRHLMCFYGDDLMAVRLAAMRLNLNTTNFIRLAIALYLPSVAMEFHGYKRAVIGKKLFWHGTKLWRQIQQQAVNMHGRPILRQQAFASFLPWQWWPPARMQFV